MPACPFDSVKTSLSMMPFLVFLACAEFRPLRDVTLSRANGRRVAGTVAATNGDRRIHAERLTERTLIIYYL
jgi:hypothetical protein